MDEARRTDRLATPAVRRWRADDDPRAVRELRLEMLADAPLAFIQRLDDAQRQPMRHWAELLARFTASEVRVMFVAEADDRWVGQAGGYLDEAGLAHLVSVYVTPAYRGSGLVGELADRVLGWARAQGCTEIRLELARENGRAMAVYRRMGFRPTGRSKPHPLYPQDSVEVEMSRPL